MIHIPEKTESTVVVDKLVEFVDVFPTLVEAAGLPPLDLCPENSSNITACSEGNSLMPLINNPEGEWKKRVFMQFPRGNTRMGYSMRTPEYRYTEWVYFENDPVYKPDWDDVRGVELYDHEIDPDENINRAEDPDYQAVVQELQTQLHLGWRYAWV